MLIRVRSKVGTWRFDGFEASSKVGDIMKAIEEKYKIPAEEQALSRGPGGKDPVTASQTLGALGIAHGDMLHAEFGENEPLQQGGPKKINSDGSVVQSYDETKGFRPGMRSLRSIKMNWTLGDFMEMDSEFEFKVKRQEKGSATEVSLDNQACNVFQQYMRESCKFSESRCGFLYGKVDKEGKVKVECIFEPDQQAREGNPQAFDMFEDPLEEKANKIAEYLGYERVGWIIAHPPRKEGFDLSAAETLFACEQRMEIGKDKVFVTVKVTPDEEGNAVFDAFQVSDQCLEMFEAGALQEHENPEYCGVNETFSAIVESREVPVVEVPFFLITVPITQHDSGLSSDFPKANRRNRQGGVVPQTRDSLASVLADKGNLPFVERIADFALLIYLCEFMDINAEMAAVCQSVANREIPLEEGYQMIIESLSGM